MKKTRISVAALVAMTLAALAILPLRATNEVINYADINKIKAEGLQRSQVMDLSSWLSDVYAPRLTGSPMYAKAADWAIAKMKEWGLANVKAEPWLNRNGFDRGWTNDKYYMAVTSPEPFPIPGTPTGWTPGTNGLIHGEAVLVTAATPEELAAYKGKLKGKWVLTQAVPDVPAYWTVLSKRFTNEELAAMELNPAPGLEFGVTPPGQRAGAPVVAAPVTPAPQAKPAAAPAAVPAAPAVPAAGQRGGFGAMNARNEFFRAEGVLGLLSTTPRGHGIYTIGGNRAADPATTLPAVVIPAEQYGRIGRMLAKKIPVTIEADIKSTYYPNPQVFNVVGEIPGTDKADEIVMLGGHLDTWHAATGAADDGCGVTAMMEAMRILKATGVKLRRTVRIGLWGAEEQGLIGSREYVAAHFAARQAAVPAAGAPPAAVNALVTSGQRGGFGGPQGPLEFKPEYDKLSAYYNIDNGTGAIRGIYLQGNDAAGPIFREWIEALRGLGVTAVTIRNTSGTDHQSFDGVGLPGFQFIQDETEYNPIIHHTNQDTYERLQPNDMMKDATIAAVFAYLTANRDEKIPRKPLAAQGQRGR
ncbi:MAG: M20/M25/M40 family metallo-hydrolase [Candidatus Aminicenantes bacterium]|nr:M20/M25/M40 family metallo-hydrolase [Candidatus Aminicenantes bacterium]